MDDTSKGKGEELERPNTILKWILPSHGRSRYPIQLPVKKRDWMDNNGSHAYKCLPLSVANAFGWEILNPVSFDATWNGSLGHGGETIKFNFYPETDDEREFVKTEQISSHFGSGIITFSGLNFIIRTSPNHNIFLKGPTNHFKHGAKALEAIMESDWLPYTFTLNWKLTAPGVTVKFEKGEPLACLFPFPRNYLESFKAIEVVGDKDSELNREHLSWVKKREAGYGKPNLLYVKGVQNAHQEQTHMFEHHQKTIRACPFSMLKPTMAFEPNKFAAKTFDEVLSLEECDKILNYAKTTDAWESVSNNFWDKRTIYYHNLPDDLKAILKPKYEGIQKLFRQEYCLDASLYPDTITLVRWFPGMEQPPHCDDMSDSKEEHPKFKNRFIGSIVYLNDDFTGGETYYPQHNFKITPKRGTLAVHLGDNNHRHGVTKVEGNVRYTIASFWSFDPKTAVAGIDWA